MDGQCVKHQFEPAMDLCRHCGDDFCEECLVYAFGRGQAPYCIACALAASGVRSNAGRPPKISRRELRKRRKERSRADRDRASIAPAMDVRAVDAAVAVDDVGIDWTLPDDPPSESGSYAWAEPERLVGTKHRVPF